VPSAIRNVLLACFDRCTADALDAYHAVQSHIREQFTITLTHDLRTPLTAIKSFADVLAQLAASPEQVSDVARRISKSVDRMDRMIHDLLDASRVGGGQGLQLEIEHVDLAAVLSGIVDDLRATHGDRFRFMSDGPLRAKVDPQALRRAVENLAINAVKYGAPGTPITIRLARRQGRAEISVHNEGKPIPPDDQRNLFVPFWRPVRAEGKKGWGIGLPLVRGVVEAHGGSVGVASEPGAGTTFTLDLPLDGPSSGPEEQPEPVPARQALHRALDPPRQPRPSAVPERHQR
ncbi:MAG TPA: HAMP domain-containing sensor histidine kinase, partial [Planctomycetota bacterium]|nr:HAMP domain-containing sensor histidine kinase [Planctomycetota bacterium]